MRRTSRPSHRASGFTIIELLIVIGIVVLLAGLTVTVSSGLREKAMVNQTENVLRLLDMAMTEWEQSAGRKLSWGVDDSGEAFYDIRADTTPDLQVVMMLQRIRRTSVAKEILAQIDQKYLVQPKDNELVGGELEIGGDGEPIRIPQARAIRVVDAWGQPIFMIHPGSVPDSSQVTDPQFYADGGKQDQDLTVRVSNDMVSSDLGTGQTGNFGWEDMLGVCISRRVCFVSAGPDEEFGELYLDVPNESDLTGDDREDLEEATDNIYSYPVEKIRRRP